MPYLLCRSRTPFVKPIPWTSPFVRPRLSTNPFVRPRTPFVDPRGEFGLRAAAGGRLTRPRDPRDGSTLSASRERTAPTAASAGGGHHGDDSEGHEEGADLGGEQVQRAESVVRLTDERDAEEVVEERTEDEDRAAKRDVDSADVEDHPVAPTGPQRASGRDPRGRLDRFRLGHRKRRDFPVPRHRYDGLFDHELRALLSIDLDLRSSLRVRGRGNLLERDFGLRQRFGRCLVEFTRRDRCIGLGRRRLGRFLIALRRWSVVDRDGGRSRSLDGGGLRRRTLGRRRGRIAIRRPGLELDLLLLVFELFLVELFGHQMVFREPQAVMEAFGHRLRWRARRAPGPQNLDKDPALRAEGLGLVPEGLERSSAIRAKVRGQLGALIRWRMRRRFVGHRILKGSLPGRINMGSRFAGVIIRYAYGRPPGLRLHHEKTKRGRCTSWGRAGDTSVRRTCRLPGQSGTRASGNAGDHGADPDVGLPLRERLVDRRSDARAVIATWRTGARGLEVHRGCERRRADRKGQYTEDRH